MLELQQLLRQSQILAAVAQIKLSFYCNLQSSTELYIIYIGIIHLFVKTTADYSIFCYNVALISLCNMHYFWTWILCFTSSFLLHFSRMLSSTSYMCKNDKIPRNEGAKSWVLKVILEMRVPELETDEGILEMRVQK